MSYVRRTPGRNGSWLWPKDWLYFRDRTPAEVKALASLLIQAPWPRPTATSDYTFPASTKAGTQGPVPEGLCPVQSHEIEWGRARNEGSETAIMRQWDGPSVSSGANAPLLPSTLKADGPALQG